MLYRKIERLIEEHLTSHTKKILLIDGARQVGKTYIIRHVGQKLFENFIEINMVADAEGDKLFAETKTVEDFYLQVSMLAGNRMKEKENTLIFIDEIQAYPHLLTLLKFLSQDDRFTYVASGSLLGVTLSQTTSVPMGSIRKVRMFPLDFEEFLYANGMNEIVVSSMRKKFERLEALDEAMHNKIMDIFRKYLLVGGLPDAVNAYLETKNIQTVREIQREIHAYYAADASKYDAGKKLKIRRIFELIPSNMENKKKRVVAQSIENKKGKTFNDYTDEFEYLISAGIALHVQAISNPVFPLIESTGKNLLKLYLNDAGILSGILYGPTVGAVVAVFSDIISCLTSPNPSVNPIITVGAASIGIISGCVSRYLIIKSNTFFKVSVSVFLSHIVGSMIIKSIGLHIFMRYEIPVLLLRIPLYLLIATCETAILYIIMKNKYITALLAKHMDKNKNS